MLKRISPQDGFTLIEMYVATAATFILATLLVTLPKSVNIGLGMIHAEASIQTQYNTAMDLIVRDIQHARNAQNTVTYTTLPNLLVPSIDANGRVIDPYLYTDSISYLYNLTTHELTRTVVPNSQSSRNSETNRVIARNLTNDNTQVNGVFTQCFGTSVYAQGYCVNIKLSGQLQDSAGFTHPIQLKSTAVYRNNQNGS